MDSSNEIRNISLKQAYETEIFGLGEVYEIMSVENIRKKLMEQFPEGTLYLSANKSHIQRGITLDDLEKNLADSGYTVLAKGYADSPFWQSKPRGKDNRRNYNPSVIALAKIIFFFMVRMESLRACSRHSHMVYCLVKK